MKKRVVVGLSGGVDSAAAALLLKQKGYAVKAVFLRCFSDREGCRSEEDRAEALRVAIFLGLPFEVWDFEKEYELTVLAPFFREYAAGKTPNPDVNCNKEIKFGLFYERALSEGADFLATGHYSRIKKARDGLGLFRGRDESKDQSYFLYRLKAAQLSKLLFPVGGMLKTEVRHLARRAGLPNAARKDSQGICFVGKVPLRTFLANRIKLIEGVVITPNGEVIGRHFGLPLYTIGQRRGFEIFRSLGVPLYVTAKETAANRLVVAPLKGALRQEFSLNEAVWLVQAAGLGEEVGFGDGVGVRIRHLGEIYPCRLWREPAGTTRVFLKIPVLGVAPGQSAVFYQGKRVLGGGVISNECFSFVV